MSHTRPRSAARLRLEARCDILAVIPMAKHLLQAGLLAVLGVAAAAAQNAPARIVIDYPADGSVFPPDMASPTFLFRDPAPNAAAWRIDIAFADGSAAIHVAAKGERMRVGEIDPRCVSPTNQPPKLTPQQAAARTWTPDAATWTAIKKQSAAGAATVTVSGFASGNGGQPVSRGRMLLHTSADPVGAPIFYRDVPLMPSEVEKGVIKPLAASAVPLIAWRLRNVGRDAQPPAAGRYAHVRQLPLLLRATARRWAWTSTVRRTTRASTRSARASRR